MNRRGSKLYETKFQMRMTATSFTYSNHTGESDQESARVALSLHRHQRRSPRPLRGAVGGPRVLGVVPPLLVPHRAAQVAGDPVLGAGAAAAAERALHLRPLRREQEGQGRRPTLVLNHASQVTQSTRFSSYTELHPVGLKISWDLRLFTSVCLLLKLRSRNSR